MIIFDEIQKFPKAREVVKYLVADGRYDYIETGSLISIMPEGAFTQYKAPEFKKPEPEPESEPEPEPGSAYLATGTSITLADGSRKLVENLSICLESYVELLR